MPAKITNCILCGGSCADACPLGLIGLPERTGSGYQGYAVLTPSECVECGECVDACDNGAIEMEAEKGASTLARKGLRGGMDGARRVIPTRYVLQAEGGWQ